MKRQKEEAKRYLEMLNPNATEFTFQTFSDRKNRGIDQLVRTFNGTLA